MNTTRPATSLLTPAAPDYATFTPAQLRAEIRACVRIREMLRYDASAAHIRAEALAIALKCNSLLPVGVG